MEQAGTEEEYSLKQFQDEMAVFAAKESSGEIESGHFLISGTATRELKPGFDPSLLAEEDRGIWEKIKNGTITLDEFHEYASRVAALDDSDLAKRSRVTFSEFAGNKAMRAIFDSSNIKKKQ